MFTEAMEEKVRGWLESNGYEAYAHYDDELPEAMVKAALAGDADALNDAENELTGHFHNYTDSETVRYHAEACIEALELDSELLEVEGFLDVIREGLWYDLSDWIETASRNTRVHITATPYTGDLLEPGKRIFEEDQDERLFLFPHHYCGEEENERRRAKLEEVLGLTPDADSNMYEFDELKVLGTLNIADIIKNGPPTHITLSPDMPNTMVAHNSVNGSGGLGDPVVTKTVTLPAMFEVDEPRYGVDAVYGFIGEVWRRELPASRPE